MASLEEEEEEQWYLLRTSKKDVSASCWYRLSLSLPSKPLGSELQNVFLPYVSFACCPTC
jgi:hypothetical protein